MTPKRAFLGFTLIACASASFAAQPQYAWIGTYNPNGEGVYRVEINAQTGELVNKTKVNVLANAAQLTLSGDGKTLFVASEVEKGVVQALRVKNNGELESLNQLSSGGSGPVHLSLTPNGRHLLVANYISGSVSVLSVKDDGSLGDVTDIQQHKGLPGAAKPAAAVEGSFAMSDHNGPHVHMAAADPQGKFVFATDLGLDRIYQYRLNDITGKLTANTPPWISASSAGAGPRHFVFMPKGDGLWLVNEEASTLTWYRLDAHSGTLSEGRTFSTLPAGYKGTSFASGLVLSADGANLYVANRLRNSISHFLINGSGILLLQDETWTGGDYPRTLTMTPDGHWLYALNQRSDNITWFRVAQKSGKLTPVREFIPVGSPSQMVISPAG